MARRFDDAPRRPAFGGSAAWKAIGMALVGLALSTACERSGDPSHDVVTGTTLERIQRDGTIRLGYANEAPYAYYDNESGTLTGEAPEIARVVLGQMGVREIEGVLTEFGSLIPGLQAGRFDIIAAGMYVTPERCREIAFSHPTYGLGQAFLVQAGNPSALHAYEDVAAHPTARLGVVAGAVEYGYARALGIPESRIVILPDPPSAVAAVTAGRVDAYAGTSLTIQHLLDTAQDPGLARADPFRDPVINDMRVIGYGAFGFRTDDTALVSEFNRHLKSLIGSPQHLDLIRRFGLTDADLPGDVTVDELCHRVEG